MSHLVLALKGMCMGFADVVPGVSGGTMALVLGIYVRFIEAIKSVNFRWILPLLRWALSGFKEEHRDAFLRAWLAIHWSFLLPLAAGIGSAIVVGAKVIPELMDASPEGMQGFFMGLILASCVIPIRAMTRRGPREAIVALVFGVMTFLVVGSHTEPALSWTQQSVEERVTLESFTRQFPSIRTPEQLICGARDDGNDALLAAIAGDPEQPNVAAELTTMCSELASHASDTRAYVAYRLSHVDANGLSILDRKHESNPFNNVIVPAGTPVQIPTPAYWFIFICGIIAICAMVLPGISGSFLLLVLGAYHFLLSSALRGMISEITSLNFPSTQLPYVMIFGLGCAIGLLSFARVMSWLFHKQPSVTMAAMVGLLLGSLRAIWPFKIGEPHIGVVNVLPTTAGELWLPALAFAVGLAIVLGFTWLGIRHERRAAAADEVPGDDAPPTAI